MRRARLAAATAGLVALGAPVAFLSSASPASAATPAATVPPIVQVCLTITPSSVGVAIDGIALLEGLAGSPTTCLDIP